MVATARLGSTVTLVHHFLHKADIVILRDVSVLQEVWPLVLWHSFKEILDNFVRNEGVPEIEFGDIWLQSCQYV